MAVSALTLRLREPPEEAEELSAIAERLLRAGDVRDVLPTPLETLYKAARVRAFDLNVHEPEGRLKRMLDKAGGAMRSVIQKVRGITDLRDRAVYIPTGDTLPRERFVRAHELAHNIIPWQRMEDVHSHVGAHLDQADDLTTEARRLFDQEANFLGAELLFQGERFKERARSYAAGMRASMLLADQHETSLQATIWKYVEAQDERIALGMYYMGNYTNGCPRLWKGVASKPLLRRYPDLEFPQYLQTGHPWRAAIDIRQLIEADIVLSCGSDGDVTFRWEAKWNGRALMVLVRQRPVLAGVGEVLRKLRR